MTPVMLFQKKFAYLDNIVIIGQSMVNMQNIILKHTNYNKPDLISVLCFQLNKLLFFDSKKIDLTWININHQTYLFKKKVNNLIKIKKQKISFSEPKAKMAQENTEQNIEQDFAALSIDDSYKKYMIEVDTNVKFVNTPTCYCRKETCITCCAYCLVERAAIGARLNRRSIELKKLEELEKSKPDSTELVKIAAAIVNIEDSIHDEREHYVEYVRIIARFAKTAMEQSIMETLPIYPALDETIMRNFAIAYANKFSQFEKVDEKTINKSNKVIDEFLANMGSSKMYIKVLFLAKMFPKNEENQRIASIAREGISRRVYVPKPNPNPTP